MMIYQATASALAQGEAAALCTIVSAKGSTPRHAGSKMLVYSDGHFIGTVGGGEVEQRVIKEALAGIADRKPRLLVYHMVDPENGDPGVCGGTMEVFVEPIIPQPTVLVIGGGHVGKSVVQLAHWLGFRVVVSDDREDLCNPSVHPDADEHLVMPMSEIIHHIDINRSTNIILTTRGSSVDVEGLAPLLESSAGYIGVIGSRRRWESTRKGLLEKGVQEDSINRVHSPIGLELEAETPEEIAVSILAEVIMLQNHGSGKIMKA